ncbi:MAG: protein-export chaperone SecB [Gammaproteobacteria bacterium]|jgi:preprotein translocase subunit SecB|tara:strand:+ start:276 stop:713 length:438 start_codon:yes stop_codon:yes gene_type:complete
MTDNKVQFNIQRIYLKDLSFESPMTPDIFTNMSSSPKVGFNFESNISNIGDDTHELTLTFNVKAEVESQTLYLVELKQCGVFTITIDDEEIKKRFLNVHCAEIVYPYARENISNIIQKGGFPPLFLSPIDFHTIYQNELDKRKEN